MRCTLRALVAASLLLWSCGTGDDDGGDPMPTPTPASRLATGPAPWQRTESREPCTDFNALRTPYFGDLHIHTLYSADAYIFGTRLDPRGAYEFSRGSAVLVADANEAQTRNVAIDRPLDFAAVTDHAEFFGEVDLCSDASSPVFDIDMCRLLRQSEDPADRFQVTVSWLFPAGIPNPPQSHKFCERADVDCDAAAVSVWREMQDAAEAAYDRSAVCAFTTFVGYEHTASPFGRHLHRNVIFRNERVPRFAASQLETAAAGIPQGVWSAVETDCTDAGTGCDAIIIPHNSNLSGGDQWLDPADAVEARRRRRLEPLVEIHQIKGNSECRFDRLAGRGSGTEDELCTFEQRLVPDEFPVTVPPPVDEYPRRNMVRNALKDGLLFEQILGANPFQLGFVGCTDTHNGTGGNVDEIVWEGGQGNSDATPARQIGSELRNNPGGLAVVWAEENSRDALFAALRRRETYATSGTRPLVRFFAGSLLGVECGGMDFVESSYRTGAPMGAEIGAARGDAGPRFAVLAFKDSGTGEIPGTDLQRVQIVKGWVDADGTTHERVYDVAGDPDNGAGVDPVTCDPVGRGATELCAVWEDPAFDPSQRAFYYVRVLENPTCRWSTRMCKGVGVDPFSPDCGDQAEVAGDAFRDCCLGGENDPFLQPVIQERAWTSPIWYRPEAIAGVDGALRFGPGPGTDVLELAIRWAVLPAELASRAVDVDLDVVVSDDDEIYRVTIPAGALVPGTESGRFSLASGAAAEELAVATLEIAANGGGTLRIRTPEMDLARADRSRHMMRVAVAVGGAYESEHVRLWDYSAEVLTVAD